jgi:hypothetical protein
MVAGRQIQGRPFMVRYLKSDDEAAQCHLVFVSEAASRRTAAIVRLLGNKSVLIVGESQGFLRDGGHIRFYVEESRVRFQINVDNAERARLRISSQLITLAKQ